MELNFKHIGKQVVYRMTDEESEVNNGQTYAIGFILQGWLNEYESEREPEMRVGLNLKLMNMGEKNVIKFSVKRDGFKGVRHSPNGEPLINKGEYFYGGFLTI